MCSTRCPCPLTSTSLRMLCVCVAVPCDRHHARDGGLRLLVCPCLDPRHALHQVPINNQKSILLYDGGALSIYFDVHVLLTSRVSCACRINRERRQSVVYDKTDSEAIPMSTGMYKMSRKLTKEMIYPATLGSEAGTEDSMAKKAEQENVAKSQPAQQTTDK